MIIPSIKKRIAGRFSSFHKIFDMICNIMIVYAGKGMYWYMNFRSSASIWSDMSSRNVYIAWIPVGFTKFKWCVYI